VDSFKNEPDGRISFRHDAAGQGGFGDSDGGGRKYITKEQYKLTFDPKYRLANLGQASRDAYGLPRYPTNAAREFNEWLGGKLRKGLDWGLSTEARTAGTSGLLAALAGGVGGTLLAQRAGDENPIKKGLLMALIAGTTGAGMSTFLQDRNNRRESMLAQKSAAISDETAYLRSVILGESSFGSSEKASILKGLAKMDDDERDELAERARKLFGFGAGMYIARVLFSKGLIPPIIGGIIGAALLTPSNKPKLNPWGQPFK
jgi:hypothetical protein